MDEIECKRSCPRLEQGDVFRLYSEEKTRFKIPADYPHVYIHSYLICDEIKSVTGVTCFLFLCLDKGETTVGWSKSRVIFLLHTPISTHVFWYLL